MTVKWRSVDRYSPDWQDTGPIEARRGKKIVRGELSAVDVAFNGEDEYPIFEFILDDGGKASIWDFEFFRARQTKTPRAG